MQRPTDGIRRGVFLQMEHAAAYRWNTPRRVPTDGTPWRVPTNGLNEMSKMHVLLLFIFFSISSFCQTGNGKKAPLFSLEGIDGDIISLEEVNKKGPVVIIFWGVGCLSCIEQLQEFEKIYQEYKDSNLTVIGIPFVNEKTISKVVPFIKMKGITFPIALDPNNETAKKYYVQMVPASAIINNGRIIYQQHGYMEGDEIKMKEMVRVLLKK